MMKGLQLCKSYYLEYGKSMIENEFFEYKDKIAVGLVGHGSECYGFDDNLSLDHDFEPRFFMWIDEDTEKEIGFKLFRAYSSLPKEYLGFKIKEKSLGGGNHKGVMTINDFYSSYLPYGKLPTTKLSWLNISDEFLAECTNGEVFCDNLGAFSKIRNDVKANYPYDVTLKKLASALFYMAQCGQYNYPRCLKREDSVASALYLSKFISNTIHTCHLLCGEFMPYDKWANKSLKKLPKLSEISPLIEKLTISPLDKNNSSLIEEICKIIIDELIFQGLTSPLGDYVEPYAFSVQNKIKDGNLRNMPIML